MKPGGSAGGHSGGQPGGHQKALLRRPSPPRPGQEETFADKLAEVRFLRKLNDQFSWQTSCVQSVLMYLTDTRWYAEPLIGSDLIGLDLIGSDLISLDLI